MLSGVRAWWVLGGLSDLSIKGLGNSLPDPGLVFFCGVLTSLPNLLACSFSACSAAITAEASASVSVQAVSAEDFLCADSGRTDFLLALSAT